MKTIKLSEVKIPEVFSATYPNENKMRKVAKYVQANGRIDKPLVLNNGVLVDNYIRYLVALETGLSEVPFVELQQMNYIVGQFNGNGKAYVWKNNRNIDVEIGDKVIVRTRDKNGKSKKGFVTVVGIFTSDSLKLYNKHKSVLANVTHDKLLTL